MKIAFKEASILLLLALVLAGLTRLVVHAPQKPREAFTLSFDEAMTIARPVCWIDARSRKQFEIEHIPDAVLLNEDAWEELLPQLLSNYSPDQTLIVYCDSSLCDASRQVAKRLRDEVGLKDVYTLEGGWPAWKARAAQKQ